MSYTSIPDNIRLLIWLRAGGRCEYRGCNEILWKDSLTLTYMNRAYLAHIIADRPKGPRGDAILSLKLKADPSNIMLLCDTHHRLIDKVKVKEHPPELLQAYKLEHEERIERLTGLQANLRTEILLFGTKIGNRRGDVNFEDACEAVLPERYPADEKGIRIDLTSVNINEKDPMFGQLIKTHIDRELARYLDDNKGPSGKPISHLSIFALAPIPALIYLGKRLGDIRSADVYQRRRQPPSWKWKKLQDEKFDFLHTYPNAENLNTNSKVVINLSLSNPIHNTEIENFMGVKYPIYMLSIAHPHRDFLQAKEQLELFCNEWYKLLSRILSTHGGDCEIHLFPAVPNSIAVEIGRSLLKIDPPIIIYDRYDGDFKRAFSV